jgi:hypothetical protein
MKLKLTQLPASGAACCCLWHANQLRTLRAGRASWQLSHRVIYILQLLFTSALAVCVTHHALSTRVHLRVRERLLSLANGMTALFTDDSITSAKDEGSHRAGTTTCCMVRSRCTTL